MDFGFCCLSKLRLAVAMVVLMAVALVRPGGSKVQKTVLSRHLPSHYETLMRFGLRLLDCLHIYIYGFSRAGASSTRNGNSVALGKSNGSWSLESVVSCARNVKKEKRMQNADSMAPAPSEAASGQVIPQTTKYIVPLCRQMRFLLRCLPDASGRSLPVR